MRSKKFRSKKALQKRVKISATGMLKCHHAGNAHLAAHKTNHQKKRLDKPFSLSRSDVSRLKKVIGAKLSKKKTGKLVQQADLVPKPL